MTIPMSQPDITSAERAAVLDVLSGSTLALGPRLDLFERRLAAYVGATHGVGVSSGTAGLHLCVLAAGIGEGDVVAHHAVQLRRFGQLRPLRARPAGLRRRRSRNAHHRPERARERARAASTARGERVKAILPVHVFGHPADMDPIRDVAARYGLAVIEDACEASGRAIQGPRRRHARRRRRLRLLPEQADDHGRGRHDRHRRSRVGQSLPQPAQSGPRRLRRLAAAQPAGLELPPGRAKRRAGRRAGGADRGDPRAAGTRRRRVHAASRAR